MREVFDTDPLAPFNIEEKSNCLECGDEVDEGKDYCSHNCWKASML